MISVPHRDTTSKVYAGDAELIEASEEALKSLDTYLEVYREQSQDWIIATVQIAMPPATDSSSIVYVSDFTKNDDGTYSGRVSSMQRGDEGPETGSTITFTYDDITDWGFKTQEGTNYGSYTSRVLLSRQSKALQSILGKKYKGKPLPEGW